MKNKNILKVFGIMLLVTFVLTWVVPSTTIESSKLTVGVTAPTGFADIFTSIDVLLVYFMKPTILMLFIGMFYGVINKSGSYKSLVDEIISIFKEHRTIFLGLTVLFYAVTTAFTGIYLPMFMFMPLSISILLGLKYGKMQTLLATFGSVVIGITAEISNYVLKSITASETNTFFWIKLGLLILMVALEILFVIRTSSKKDKKVEINENTIMFVPEKRDAKKEKKTKGISLFVVLILLFATFVLGLTVWKDNTMFANLYTSIQNIKIGEFAIFDAILGEFETFGEWTYTSLYPTLSLAIIVVAILGKLSFSETIEGAVNGAKKIMGLAIFAALINLVVVFTLNSGFVATIINVIAKSGNVALITLSSLISSPFMVESAYASQYLMQLIYNISSNDAMLELYGLIVQFAYGFTMLIAPSSILLMVGLCYLEEKYTKWIKYVWKFVLAILVLCLIAITVATLI